jgi:O-antigen/teichoic acid export membrane protein
VSQIQTEEATTSSTADAAERRRAEIGPGGLRHRVAGGTIVNTLYLLAMNGLSIVQGLLIVRLLGASEYGVWGLLAGTFGTLLALAAVGFDDKYIQQDHPDQQAAFEIAFTLQALLVGFFTVLAIVTVPLFAMLYDQPRILAPGLLIAASMPLIALQTPNWVFYRRMNFARQRLLEGLQPVSSFLVTVSLAVAGFGFWALVIGTLVGAVVASTAAVIASPYKLRFRYERGAWSEYAKFSWPLMFGSVSGVVTFQVPITLASRALGPAAIGGIALASQLSQYTRRVDDIVTHALYPAICAVKDQRQLLFEAFSKSNRLALLWGFPAGVGAALFARQVIPHLLGDRWVFAIPLIQILCLKGAVDQIGFNWSAFARARGDTTILATGAAVFLVVSLPVGIPLLLAHGVTGFGIGLAAGGFAMLVFRLIYLMRLFPGLRLVSHVAAGVAPTVPAAGLILAERAILGPADDAWRIVAEIVAFVLVVATVTCLVDRSLLREALGYVRRAARRDTALAS